MAPEILSAPQRAALLTLLDDPSPTVRHALLARFAALGPAAAALLHETIHGPDRLLARHAAACFAALKFADPATEFRAFIRSLHYELETGFLLLARTVSPHLVASDCHLALDALAARCRALVPASAGPREHCHILNRVLFHEHGFRGNTEHFTDPRNSLLDHVLARRTGIPISLSIVYLLVGERLGLPLEPVGLPGHFIVGCFAGDLPFFIDPFDQGRVLDADAALDLARRHHIDPSPTDLLPTPVREVLCRACRNLVNHYTASADPDHARLFAGFVGEFEATHAKHAS
ncbi:MAG: hypothetical protein RLZZ15_3858 [Verrucomicrobiota bacterium]